MAFAKKLNKFKKDPKQFFIDALKKKMPDMPRLNLRCAKYETQYSYTIISAVYGVEKYIDKFIASVINQTASKVQLILVDDGSLDGSAKKIEVWRKKHPNQIKYFKKENGGQASARNLGLKHATGDWVTFADSDDFLNPEYIEAVDKLICSDQTEKISLVCCKWRLFFDGKNTYSDNHPLNYRFKNGNKIVDPFQEPNFMASSPATSFYKLTDVQQLNLEFDERIRPNFEDGHFTGIYLASAKSTLVGYCADSVYFYRKRSDGSSTLDNSWENTGRFDEVMRFGYLDLLNRSQSLHEKVPLSIQRLIMYDVFWYIKKIANNESSISFLTVEQKARFFNYLIDVFAFINPQTIMQFELAGIWFYHKVAILGLFKNEPPSYQVVYIEQFDEAKQLLQLRYFYHGDDLPLDRFFDIKTGVDVEPVYEKTRLHDFIGHTFVKERLVWIKLDSTVVVAAQIGDMPTRLSLAGKDVNKIGVTANAIQKHFAAKKSKVADIKTSDQSVREYSQRPDVKTKFSQAWMILDRDTQADDNGEHFYRYIMRSQPQINAYFVLLSDSYDWTRLSDEGFKLIPFGSLEHKALMLNAVHVISSHPDSFTLNFLPAAQYGDLLNFKYTFLQHGVIRDDISNWLNTKAIDCFVTSSPAETESISGRESNYKFSRKEVVQTGLARHDALLDRDEPTENVIILMPTWRQSLVGSTSVTSTKRVKSDAFSNSEYAQRWRSVLHSKKLQALAQQYGYKVVFFPHANMQMYLDWFDAPEWIEMRSHQTDPVLQKLFRRAKVLVTDYSSVFFEFGIQDKAVVYYQFDFEQMYGAATHTSRLGYFDFESDGFGPVCYEENTLLTSIETILNNGGAPSDSYLKRMKETLPLRDGLNRERTYNAIVQLDAPERAHQTIDVAYYAQKARATLKNGFNPKYADVWLRLAGDTQLDSSRTSMEWQSLLKSSILSDETDLFAQLTLRFKITHSNVEVQSVLIAVTDFCASIQSWQRIVSIYQQMVDINDFSHVSSAQTNKLILNVLRASAELSDENTHALLVNSIQKQVFNLNETDFNEVVGSLGLFSALSKRDWQTILNQFAEKRRVYQNPRLILVLLRAQIAQKYHAEAEKQISLLMKMDADDLDWRLQNAHLKYKTAQYKDIQQQVDAVFGKNCSTMPNHINKLLFQTQVKLGQKEAIDFNGSRGLLLSQGQWLLEAEVFDLLALVLAQLQQDKTSMTLAEQAQFNYLKFFVCCYNLRWVEAKLLFKSLADPDWLIYLSPPQAQCLQVMHLRVLAAIGEPAAFAKEHENLLKHPHAEQILQMVRLSERRVSWSELSLWQHLAHKNWLGIISSLAHVDDEQLSPLDGMTKDAQIILSIAYRNVGHFEQAFDVVKSFEKHTKNYVACRVEIALLEVENGWWEKVANQLKQAYPEGRSSMPEDVKEVWDLPLVCAFTN